MKISEKWLREWANPPIDSDALVHQLTMAGLEVDSVESAQPAFDGVVVAEVQACEQHPNADKLNLCRVDDGSGEPVQVICGAKNVRAGLKVAFARVGASLPGIRIKKAKLRGVESFGMICSESELQLSDDSSGIMELPQDAPVGVPLAEYLDLDDRLIEIDLTPNRGDCLSILGVAREVVANNDITLTPVAIEAQPVTIDERFALELFDPEACPHYAGRIIRGIDASATTPLWMKEKLRRSGLRPISPVVDVTNFVMMELGQPMHGFDLDRIEGGIRVRRAEAGERLELLDGSEVECRDDTLVIADHGKALALAGIMGGQASSVQDDTRNILLESAFFTPSRIAGKARSYGLHTDSSHRFERGVDPELQVRALERATELLLAIVGGQAGPVVSERVEAHIPERPRILLRHARVERMLGIEIDAARIGEILRKLDMQVEGQGDDWRVTGPSWRFDIAIEADLVEEIGRIVGYDNIPGTREAAHVAMSACSETEIGPNRLRDALTARGYFEAITYSFVSPELQQLLHPGQATLSLANPISSDMSEMRTRLLPGLIQALRHNLNRQQGRVRLFETGLCFVPQENGDLQQIPHLAALITGPAEPEGWNADSRMADFYDIKGDLQSLMLLAEPGAFDFRPSEEPILHPGQGADVWYQGDKVGFVGALHPSLLEQLDIDQPVYLFEIEQQALGHHPLPSFRELSRFPSIRRDLALLVNEETAVSSLLETIAGLGDEKIRDAFVFDVYTGKELTNNRKSVALGLILQDFSRTLTDQEVEESVAAVLHALEQKHNAVLR
jgi:phenylalanyl-tRNA synthetase beta chain